MVLDVKKGEAKAGAQVITYTEHGKANQLWYDDLANGTICSKQTGFCMDLDGETLVVRPYEKDAHNQKWEKVDMYIKSRNNSKKVLDIYGAKKAAGAKVGVYDFNGQPNQQWDFVMVPGVPAGPGPVEQAAKPSTQQQTVTPQVPLLPGRQFFIVSEKSEKVVDIQAASMAADAKAILWTRNASQQVKNQLWYFDEHFFIRSFLNHFVFQNKDSGKILQMAPFTNTPRGQWTVDGKKIVNRTGECLMVKGDDKDDGAELSSGHYKGAANQHWIIQYV